jgi:hypothetical protein
LYAEILYLEPEGRGIRNRDPIEPTVGDVNHSIATQTDEVMVNLGAPVVADDAPGVTSLADDAKAGQVLEGAIDRSAGDA